MRAKRYLEVINTFQQENLESSREDGKEDCVKSMRLQLHEKGLPSQRPYQKTMAQDKSRASLEQAKENADQPARSTNASLVSRERPMKDCSNLLSNKRNTNLQEQVRKSSEGIQKVAKTPKLGGKASKKEMGTQMDDSTSISTQKESDITELQAALERMQEDLNKTRIENIKLKNDLKTAQDSLNTLRNVKQAVFSI